MNFAELKNALDSLALFSEKTWKLSPDAWTLPDSALRVLDALGNAVPAFYRALEKLYRASAENKKILRNGELRAPWVAPLLDRGKPPRLVAHQRSRACAGRLPPVLRPDLLICENGFALTELDSVPGGIGLTAFLSRFYGVSDAMPDAFFRAIAPTPQAAIVIAVSDESSDYRREFEWLADVLRSRGAKISVRRPDALKISPDGVFCDGEKIDVLYRFFELFDLKNVCDADALFEATERGNVVVSPPMRPFQEEKASLALLHNPVLTPFWQESLGAENFSLMKEIVPETWLVEPAPKGGLPAGAVLLAPQKNGLPIRDWAELADAHRRDRDLVLKASGFDPSAWGARSVTVGGDSSQEEWVAALSNALVSAREKNTLFVAQRFRKPARLTHRVYSDGGEIVPAAGRVRICPYYFAENSATGTPFALRGALCTFCPPDKKIIHGMSDAVFVPVNLKNA